MGRVLMRRVLVARVALALVALLGAAACDAVACDLERPSGTPPCTRTAVDRLPLNAIQFIGTHNSYKQAMAPGELAAHRAVDAAGADSLDYAHPRSRSSWSRACACWSWTSTTTRTAAG